MTVHCPVVNGHDENTTVTASEFIAAFSAGLFYNLIFFLSILSVCFRSCVRLSSSQGTFFVFLIGALLAFINVFTNADNLTVKLCFRISITVLMGIAFTLFGAALFFSQPQQERNEATLGQKQPSMGILCCIDNISSHHHRNCAQNINSSFQEFVPAFERPISVMDLCPHRQIIIPVSEGCSSRYLSLPTEQDHSF